ncbi:uncharacterized protein TNCV_3389541 [Trichonephila clavipes]|nr:uncharacterized protein TNCV_3389541 [Trichonephila clavipes]
MYYAIFYNEFNLGIFSPKKNRCELCSRNENSNGAEIETIKEQYENHLLEKDLSRSEKDKDKASPDNTIVAVYDLQAVLPCPIGDVSTFYYVSKLNVFNTLQFLI